jgi:hypothetical protein
MTVASASQMLSMRLSTHRSCGVPAGRPSARIDCGCAERNE